MTFQLVNLNSGSLSSMSRTLFSVQFLIYDSPIFNNHKIKSNFSFWPFHSWKSSFTYFSKLSLVWNIKFSPGMFSHHFLQFLPSNPLLPSSYADNPMLNVILTFFIFVFFRLILYIKILSKTNFSCYNLFSPLLLHPVSNLFNCC